MCLECLEPTAAARWEASPLRASRRRCGPDVQDRRLFGQLGPGVSPGINGRLPLRQHPIQVRRERS